MKTVISIPDELFRSAESLAKRLKVSRSQLYAIAIADLLARNRSRQITERLNDVYRRENSALQRKLMLLQARSLPQEDWTRLQNHESR